MQNLNNILLKIYTWSINKIHNLLNKQKDQLSTYEQVKLFHKTFNVSMPDSPTPLSKEDALIRASFITEEIIEFLHASSNNKEELVELFGDLVDKMEVSLAREIKKEFPKTEFERLVSQVDVMCDIKYYNAGDFTLIGVDPTKPIQIVQNANMSKLWEDNKPRFNEVGKIIKPPLWSPPEPEIEAEIKRQIEAAKENT